MVGRVLAAAAHADVFLVLGQRGSFERDVPRERVSPAASSHRRIDRAELRAAAGL